MFVEVSYEVQLNIVSANSQWIRSVIALRL